ncbi:D-lactaldehyde dehydrogenase [Roridomyces roridus]|uniref:D-lactaldehyde dehydrogenase n=1 Tax=Roridomyces roridus TaxID=1738132 RepID=A0AAD7B3D8_9AGAR|nr:D-lactaldehyde dehydrogenase [Roridomyces roridus]
MPSIQSGKVLVSGANGFVATWCVQTFLDAGFSVRGTVRNAIKGKHLKRFFSSYGDKFELVVVPDITAPGAFDEAVTGVDAIAHTASPFHLAADDPADLSGPSVQGTIGILESARKYGQTVKRIVITSSAVAVTTPKDGPLDEYDWNNGAVQAVADKGAEAATFDKYCNSKVLAERGAWEFLDKHKTEVGWDIAVLNPPLILGPVIHDVSTPEELNTSTKMMFNAFTTESPTTGGGQWANVKDVGRAHLLTVMTELPSYVPLSAVNKHEGRNVNRFIIGGQGFTWQDMLDAAPPSAMQYKKGFPGSINTAMRPRDMDNTRSQEVLGMEYTSIHETVEETLADYERRGWIKPLGVSA